jgi:hypothetical protein
MLVIRTLVKVTYRNRVGMSKFETEQDINTHAQATEPIDYCDEKIS